MTVNLKPFLARSSRDDSQLFHRGDALRPALHAPLMPNVEAVDKGRRRNEDRGTETMMNDFEPAKAGSNRLPRNGVFLPRR